MYPDLDRALEKSLVTAWNARVVDYDENRFAFHEWILDRIQKMGYPLDDLTQLHKVVPDDKIYDVTKQLCADTGLPEFKKMIYDFVREVVVPEGELKTPVAVQRFLNVRIMVPDKPEGIFPFHSGLFYGHGLASRSLWLPLTDVTADEDITASMQIIDVERSRELVSYAIENMLGVDEMTELFGKESWQCKARPGKAVFFTQENVHGNFVNVTGKTRVSIDFRIAEAQYGNKLARKIAGGYFEIIPDSATNDERYLFSARRQLDNGKRNLIYLNNSTRTTIGIPVHLQRYMVVDYCQKNGLDFGFELFELEGMTHLPTLRHIVDNLKCNAVLYSVYSLPEDKAFRDEVTRTAIENGVIMHFVNEDLVIENEADRDTVERLLEFAKFGSETAVGFQTDSAARKLELTS